MYAAYFTDLHGEKTTPSDWYVTVYIPPVRAVFINLFISTITQFLYAFKWSESLGVRVWCNTTNPTSRAILTPPHCLLFIREKTKTWENLLHNHD